MATGKEIRPLQIHTFQYESKNKVEIKPAFSSKEGQLALQTISERGRRHHHFHNVPSSSIAISSRLGQRREGGVRPLLSLSGHSSRQSEKESLIFPKQPASIGQFNKSFVHFFNSTTIRFCGISPILETSPFPTL